MQIEISKIPRNISLTYSKNLPNRPKYLRYLKKTHLVSVVRGCARPLDLLFLPSVVYMQCKSQLKDQRIDIQKRGHACMAIIYLTYFMACCSLLSSTRDGGSKCIVTGYAFAYVVYIVGFKAAIVSNQNQGTLQNWTNFFCKEIKSHLNKLVTFFEQ